MLNPEGFGLLPIVEADPGVLQGFNCGKERLNTFLLDFASDWHKRRLGFTTLVFHEESESLVGYFTLAHDAILLNDSERLEVEADTELSSFPSVKLGRLAVSKALQGSGVGGQILRLSIGEIVSSETLSAARLMVVDADNDVRVVNFYERFGFQSSLWAERQARNHGRKKDGPASTRKMWIDLLAIPSQVD